MAARPGYGGGGAAASSGTGLKCVAWASRSGSFVGMAGKAAAARLLLRAPSRPVACGDRERLERRLSGVDRRLSGDPRRPGDDRRAGDERRLPEERRLSRVPTEPSRDEDRRRLRGFGGGFGAKKLVWFLQQMNALPGVALKNELLVARTAGRGAERNTNLAVSALKPACGAKQALTGFSLNPHHAAGVDWPAVRARRPDARVLVWDRTVRAVSKLNFGRAPTPSM